MIGEPDPRSPRTICFIRDDMGGALTVQTLPPGAPASDLAIVVSDVDGGPSGIFLDADDRRALAAALLDGLDE